MNIKRIDSIWKSFLIGRNEKRVMKNFSDNTIIYHGRNILFSRNDAARVVEWCREKRIGVCCTEALRIYPDGGIQPSMENSYDVCVKERCWEELTAFFQNASDDYFYELFFAESPPNTPLQLRAVDNLLKKYKVQPVGNGYIDCIIAENAEDFIDELTALGITVTALTWWYFSKSGDENLPLLAMGGPKSVYYDGWFAEMNVNYKTFDDGVGNEEVKRYLRYTAKAEPFYAENLVPGLWLDIDKV